MNDDGRMTSDDDFDDDDFDVDDTSFDGGGIG